MRFKLNFLSNEFLRDVISRDIRSKSESEKIALVAHCLASRNETKCSHFLELLASRGLIPDSIFPQINQKAVEVRNTPSTLTTIAEYLKDIGDGGYDRYSVASRTRSFANLQVGTASDVSIGKKSKTYTGPETDCDPMGQVDVYVIMPIAVNEKTDPVRIASEWLKSFETVALGN